MRLGVFVASPYAVPMELCCFFYHMAMQGFQCRSLEGSAKRVKRWKPSYSFDPLKRVAYIACEALVSVTDTDVDSNLSRLAT